MMNRLRNAEEALNANVTSTDTKYQIPIVAPGDEAAWPDSVLYIIDPAADGNVFLRVKLATVINNLAQLATV